MTTKPDWHTVNELPMTHDRKPNDEPPATEEILAYMHGELSPDAEEQMRERLMEYPDLLRALSVPFPNEPAAPGDADYVTDEEWPEHWAALQKRMDRGRVAEFRRPSWIGTALAAIVAIVFAGLYWQAERKLGQPRVTGDEIQLIDMARRGPGGTPQAIHFQGDFVLLSVRLAGEPRAAYRVAMVDDSDNREVWRSDAVQSQGDLHLHLQIPRRSLVSGNVYRIRVYGDEELLGDYVVEFYAR